MNLSASFPGVTTAAVYRYSRGFASTPLELGVSKASEIHLGKFSE